MHASTVLLGSPRVDDGDGLPRSSLARTQPGMGSRPCGNHPCRLRPAHQGVEMASPVGMAGATPPQVPRGSGRHDRVAGCYFRSNRSCRLRPAHQEMKMAPPSPVRVDDSSRGLDEGRFLRSRNPACAGITMALRGPHKGMKIASSLGMVEADPAPGPSSGTPQDDMTGWPGAIFIAMTDVGVLPLFSYHQRRRWSIRPGLRRV